MPPQSQLLALRRLPRHRRGRPQQAELSRSRHPGRALEAAQGISPARRRGPSGAGKPRGRARRPRVRIHDERAAPARGLSGRLVRRAHGLADRCGREAACTSRGARVDRPRPRTHPADGFGAALPERPAAAVPASLILGLLSSVPGERELRLRRTSTTGRDFVLRSWTFAAPATEPYLRVRGVPRCRLKPLVVLYFLPAVVAS